MSNSPDIAAFFLPGLVHQFGNLLLTVQGNALQLQPDNVDRLRGNILTSVQRGSTNLQTMRVLLGEVTGATAEASDLLAQLHELARVPVRERGLSLELRGEHATAPVWVATDTFVLACAEALRQWVFAVPVGTEACITLGLRPLATGGCELRLGLEAAAGSLPFPMPAREVADAVAANLAVDGLHVAAGADQTLAVHFAALSMTSVSGGEASA